MAIRSARKIVLPTKVLSRFSCDCNGQIAIIFALASTAIFSAIGAGVDLSRAYQARQKLSEVAILACQFASRPAILQTSTSYVGNGTPYVNAVNNFIATSLQSQQFKYAQTTADPFTYSQNGAASVTLTSTVPTMFMGVVKVQSVPINVTSRCYNNPSEISQIVPNGNSTYAVKESFEVGGAAGGWKQYNIDGSTSVNGDSAKSTPKAFSSSVGVYTGATGNKWYQTGYCIEQDAAGVIKDAVADGNFSIELDCGNGAYSAGNSSISTNVYLAVGRYELRYHYSGRVFYPNYSPAYICGSTAADVSWANDTAPQGGPINNALRTNQINVYLDANTNGTPPTHVTIDGQVTLSGANLIDVCVYSDNWIERVVPITVSTAGNYWLSFAADGQNDSFGGQIDNIRLCVSKCPSSIQDNFPTAWTTGRVLFSDNFETPSMQPFDSNWGYNANGNVFYSVGTSGSASGWPNQNVSGWGIGDRNNTPYWTNAKIANACPATGTQCISLGYNQNSYISRPFLLVPGYYRVSYKYMSELYFSNLSGAVYCGTTPVNASILTLTSTTNAIAFNNFPWGNAVNDTNAIGVFMSHSQLASTPNLSSAFNSTTQFTNPDGTTTGNAKVPPNGISLSNYNAAQPNPLLDMCAYAPSWQTRSRNVFIQKTAFYWLTLAALGEKDAAGGLIDDVSITVVGSPYTGSPSGGFVTIPVPSPQPSSSLSFTGFTISADVVAP